MLTVGNDYFSRVYSAFNKDTCTLKEALEFLESIGYGVSQKDTFDYINTENSPRKTRAFYVIELDSKLGFSNVEARKGDNFGKLQSFRYWVEVKDSKITYQF